MDKTANIREKTAGLYLGTEIDGKWWRRYMADGWFVRGNGDYWLGDANFHFQRYLPDKPLVIPLAAIKSVKIGAWHSGRWSPAAPIVKINWTLNGQPLSSGFAATRENAEALKNALTNRD